MRLLPAKLNEHVIAICLIAGVYSGFRWHKGGGYGWKFLLGLCAYMTVAGVCQIWATGGK